MGIFRKGETFISADSPEAIQKALAEGFTPRDGTVQLVDPVSGRPSDIPVGDLDAKLGEGYSVEDPSATQARALGTYNEGQYGGAVDTVQTFGRHGLDTLTLGGYSALSSPETQREMRIQSEVNPGSALAGDVTAGAVALAAGGASAAGKGLAYTPAGALTRGAAALGERAAARLGTETVAGKLAGAAVQGTVEGAGFGFGQGVRELSLSDDKVTAERLIAVLGGDTLIGGVTGGSLSLIGKAAGLGVKKAGKAVSEYAERVKAGAVAEEGAEAVADADLQTLDRPALRKAKVDEVERAKTARKADLATEGRSIADDVATYHETSASDAYLATEGSQAAGIIGSSRKGLQGHLDEPISLAENPSNVLKPLRKQAGAMREALANKEKFLATVAKEEDKLAGTLDNAIKTRDAAATTLELEYEQAKKYANYRNQIDPEAGLKVKRGKGLVVSVDEAAQFRDAIRNGEVLSQRRAAMERIAEHLETNETIQARILAAKEARFADIASPRLTAIEGRMDELAAGTGPKGLAESLAAKVASTATAGAFTTLGAVVAGPAGAAAGGLVGSAMAPRVASLVSDLAAGRLSKAGAAVAGRVSGALDAFAGGVSKAERVAPMGAVTVLKNASFGAHALPKSAPISSRPLVQAFREREHELREQTVPGPDGRMQMRPEARAQMAELFKPLQLYSPLLADRMETVAARRIEFLASKLPKRPDMGAIKLGPDNWRPSDFEIGQFARYTRAAQDPAAVIERLNHGTVTPEDAEAMRAVYPEIFDNVKLELIEKLPEMQKKGIPYKKRLALTIFTGIPMDPAFTPAVLRVLQGGFAEAGTEGGTAPKATPQAGSVPSKAFEPTPAQERAG